MGRAKQPRSWHRIIGSTTAGTILLEVSPPFLDRIAVIDRMPEVELPGTLGQQVIDYCWRKDMSFRKFAYRAQVSPSTISRVTSGKVVTQENFVRIRRAMIL